MFSLPRFLSGWTFWRSTLALRLISEMSASSETRSTSRHRFPAPRTRWISSMLRRRPTAARQAGDRMQRSANHRPSTHHSSPPISFLLTLHPHRPLASRPPRSHVSPTTRWLHVLPLPFSFCTRGRTHTVHGGEWMEQWSTTHQKECTGCGVWSRCRSFE